MTICLSTVYNQNMSFQVDIYAFLRDTLLIILAWFFMATSFFIWGRFFSNLLKIRISGRKGIIANIWLGFTFCIFFFSIYHLFFPINAFASCLFYLPGFLVFLLRYSKKMPIFIKSIGTLKISAILLTLFTIAAIAIQFPIHMDTGLYHLNSIRWANEYHIIKGLGNLHDRLGFNQLFFLYSASLNFHPFFSNYSFHLSNSFLCALFFVGMFLNGLFIDLVILCLFFFIPMPYHWISCPTPDIASTFLQIVIFRYLVEIIHFDVNSKERSCFIAFAAILSALAITIKLSNGIYALGLGLITLLFNYKYKFTIIEKKVIGKSFIFIGLLLLLWVFRGYIQTGYPLFPSTIGKLSFAWTVPESIAKNQKDYIYTSACNVEINDINSSVFKNYTWLNHWFELNFFDKEVFSGDFKENLYVFIILLLFPSTINNFGIGCITLSFLSLLMLIIWIFMVLKSKELVYKTCFLFYLLVSNLFYGLFWFFTAPDPRFLNGIVIINFIICLLLVKSSIPNLIVKSKIKRAMLFYPFIVFIYNFNSFYLSGDFYINKIFVLPKHKMQEFITDSGLKILKPIKLDYNIWNSELPASPHPLKSLSLLGTTISEGFCISNKD